MPLIRATDLAEGTIHPRQLRTVTTEVDQAYLRAKTQAGDLLVGLVGGPGEVALVPASLAGANINRAVGLIRLDPTRCLPQYAYYFFRGAGRRRLEAQIVGSVQRVINLRELARVVVDVPVLCEQKRITCVLGALDDKIGSNRRLAELVEETAATVFRAWFVDYVGVENMKDTDIGPVPEGWSVGVLSDLVDVTMGQSPPGASYMSDPSAGLPLVQGMGVFGDRFPASDVFTTSPKKTAPEGSTLMTVRAPVGAVNLAREELCLGRGVAALQSKWPAFTEFLIRSLKGRWASEEAGTIFPAVNRKQILGLPIALPPMEEINNYESFARPLVGQLATLHDESGSLTGIRDTLLPKLISGEISVPDTADPEEVIGPAAEEIAA